MTMIFLNLVINSNAESIEKICFSRRRYLFQKYLSLLLVGQIALDSVQFCSISQLCPTLCDPMDCSMPCFPIRPSPTPRACSNSCASSRWCHPTISSSVILFTSCIQSFPESESFPMSQFFASGGQSIGASVSASVLPINIQNHWFPLGLTGLIPLCLSFRLMSSCTLCSLTRLSDRFWKIFSLVVLGGNFGWQKLLCHCWKLFYCSFCSCTWIYRRDTFIHQLMCWGYT